MSLWQLLAESVARHGDRPALIAADGSRRTYHALERSAAGLAAHFRALDLEPGDRVAILSRNRPEFLIAYFGAAGAGIVLAPWNTRLTAAEHAAVLADSGARYILAEHRFIPVVTEAVARAGTDTIILDIDAAWPRALRDEDEFAAAQPDPKDLAHLYYTSGTTGTPKGVMLTHANVAAHAAMTIEELRLDERDVWGHFAPMFHLADAWATFAITQAGGTHTFVADFSAAAVLDCVARDRVTLSNLVPTMLHHILAELERGPRATDSLRLVLSGGAPIAPETVATIQRVFGAGRGRAFDYVQTYGMTETSPFLTMSLLDASLRALPESEQMRYRAKTGRPVQGVQLRVVDSAGENVPTDDLSVGEVLVRGATVTPGYWHRPAETAAAFEDGWLRTGDLAVWDDRGFINLVDRKKDVILTGGETVYSTEVENRLFEHPAVREAAVVGIADPEWGERIVAEIVARDGADPTTDAVIAFCREALAGYKCPRAVFFVDALPRTGTGKIDKRAIRTRRSPPPA